jgi:hypothetical protein
MGETLKPCPFCGSRAEWFEDEHDEDSFYVSCSNLDCYATMGRLTNGKGYSVSVFGIASAAIEAWNRRAPTEPDTGAGVGRVDGPRALA